MRLASAGPLQVAGAEVPAPLGHLRGGQPVDDCARFAASLDEPSMKEHLQVFRYCGLLRTERLGELSHRLGATFEGHRDTHARRIAEGTRAPRHERDLFF